MIRHLAVFVFCCVWLAANPCSGAQKEKGGLDDKPLPYPSETISKKDSLLVRAAASEPLMLRGRRIEAPLKIVNHFFARPWLAYRLAEQIAASPLSFSLDKEGGEWEMAAIGRHYQFGPLEVDKEIKILKFTFLFRLPLGIGLKTSGGGFIVIRTRLEDGDEGSLIDYDIYLVTGSGPIDKLTRSFPIIQNSLAQADMESVISSFAMLLEAVADDPESVVDEMKDADETFSEKEVEEFTRLFVKK
ncbi:hypothetical protein MNBD_NITROSPINAE04-1018 [hydrothermal vent metagenome]|uniref:Uncharacterized protein n=1 Tax=hydrothermal vent metagenome TaxID=652676 RepID=A0A3B1C841_9ZZZZ